MAPDDVLPVLSGERPFMDGLCVGGCGVNITDANNYDPTGVHLKPGWLFTDAPHGRIRVRCPHCTGYTGYTWCRRCDDWVVSEDDYGNLLTRCPRCGGET